MSVCQYVIMLVYSYVYILLCYVASMAKIYSNLQKFFLIGIVKLSYVASRASRFNMQIKNTLFDGWGGELAHPILAHRPYHIFAQIPFKFKYLFPQFCKRWSWQIICKLCFILSLSLNILQRIKYFDNIYIRPFDFLNKIQLLVS